MGWTGSSVAMSNTIAESKSGFYFTPNIDSLMAQKGMTFSQNYAPAPKCSPSRCAILTGRTTARNQFTETGSGLTPDRRLTPPATNNNINLADTTMAEWLKVAAGYRTAHYGKWHLGSNGTAANGFDFGDGNTTNNEGGQGGTVQSDPKRIFELSTKAVDFITAAKNDGTPFYLQVSHYAVHSPTEAQQATIDLYNNNVTRPNDSNGNHEGEEYAAMTEDMDTGVGQILQAVKNLGLEGNTYVIFTSDNGGPANLTSNAPLSGGKVQLTEGGIRVPFIVKGPDVPENTYNATPIVGYDLFPTFAALTGSNAPLPQDIDGENIAPLFLNQAIARKEPLYFHSPHYGGGNKLPVSAAVDGDYKLKVDYDAGTLQLFNLAMDIGETTDLAADQPEIFNRLRLSLRNYLKEVNANMPTLNATHADWTATVQPDDADGDGLNDIWEFSNLLTHLEDANGDPDEDGQTNLEEQNGNTDPLVAEAVVACQDTLRLDGATFNGDQTISAATIVESEQTYLTGTVLYTAGESITLNPGFSVANGVDFTARIEDCTPTPTLTNEEMAALANSRMAVEENELLLTTTAIKQEPKVLIYPNPASDYVTINLLNQNDGVAIQNVQLFNLNGALLMDNIKARTGFEVGHLPKGVYLIRIRLGDNLITRKLVIN